jgi:hypothetical protein
VKQKINLSNISEETLQDAPVHSAPVTDLTGKTRIGLYMMGSVLGIILLYVILFFYFLNSDRIDASGFMIKNYNSLVDSTHIEQSKTVIQSISNEAKSYRDFWRDTNQMILLNLLLPILTALLGYIFGSREDKK